MALHVSFTEDTLKRDGSRRPRVHAGDPVGSEDLIRLMAQDTALETTDLAAALEQFRKALVHILASGRKVVTPVGTFSLGIRGRHVPGRDAEIDLDRTRINFLPNRALRSDVLERVEVKIVEEPGPRAPSLTTLRSADPASPRGVFRSGDVAQIGGHTLTFSRGDAHQGVFLVPGTAGPPGADNTGAGAANEVRVTVLPRCGPRRIDFRIPDISPGTYTVEVRARHGKGAIRVGRWRSPIEIV